MVDFYEHCGVDGMTVLGIMGEAPKLDADESLQLLTRGICGCLRDVLLLVRGEGRGDAVDLDGAVNRDDDLQAGHQTHEVLPRQCRLSGLLLVLRTLHLGCADGRGQGLFPGSAHT